MLKLILSLTFLVSLGSAFAKDCVVYGISDSPQSLNCSFQKLPSVELRCVNGNYYLNSSKVSVAFHMEVEAGPVPLVFRTSEGALTVLLHSKRNIEAYLNRGRSDFPGKCQIGN